ncbi:mitochondrial RNA-splicing protein Mrs4p [Diutina catenulata]
MADQHVIKFMEVENTPVEIDYEALPDDASLAAHLMAGAFAGIMEHTVMFPIDSLKTRMQMLGSGQSMSSSVIASIQKISSAEGAYSLWRGVSSVVMGAGPAHAVYFSVFEATKTLLVNRLTASPKTNKIVTDENHPLIASLAGIAATTASDALMNPFDVIKQRMQVSTAQNAKLGQASMDMLKTAGQIYKKEGLGAFYISYPTTLMTNIPFSSLNFGFYEYTSQLVNPTGVYSPWAHCVAGGVAGGIAAALTNPLDCVKTLLQTKGMAENDMVRNASGFWSGTRALYHEAGMAGFFKGLKPRIIFNIPATAISWTAYELAKEILLH